MVTFILLGVGFSAGTLIGIVENPERAGIYLFFLAIELTVSGLVCFLARRVLP